MEEDVVIEDDSFPDQHIFLISTFDHWYRDILIYLQTLKYPTAYSREDRRKLHLHAKNYLIIGDTLYRWGVDFVLRHCLTHEEAEIVLNDSHRGACGGHLSGLEMSQKILRVSYFWPTIFKDCVEVVKRYHLCQLYTRKIRSHPTLLFLAIAVGPFTKWGVDYMMCNPISIGATNTSFSL